MAIPYIYHPEIDLGFIKIYSFGLLVSLAFLVAIWFIVREAKKQALDLNRIYSLIFYIMLGGVIGSRIAHVLGNWDSYMSDPLTIFMLWYGGLAFYGGFIGALLFAFIFIKKKKMKFWQYADLIAPALALGHAIGRVGCLVGDGGHVGKITTLPFGVMVNGELRHLTALYSFVNLITLFVILLLLKKRKPFVGFLFLFYVAYYALTRFFIDFLRTDPTYFGLTATQWVAIPLFFIAFGVIIKKW